MPRGALFGETLDVLDAAGVDTSPLRGDSRSLIFDTDEMTLVTMRPSDVPTYVEAGAADVGITGKDVLLEQADRIVYELLDLGFGKCRMVLAGRRGDERLGESQRRLGMMRIATKYPRIAERYFEETGRQVELIEVKGSVELAPLIGLGDGIVDLVATGRTLAENDLEVREEIVDCTARFVANRVAHKLRAAEVDDLTARLRVASGALMGAMKVQRFEWAGAAVTAAAVRTWSAEAEPPVEVDSIGALVREGGDAALLALTKRYDAPDGADRRGCGSTRPTRAAALGRARPGAARGAGDRRRQHPRRRRGAAGRGAARSSSPRATRCACAKCRSAPPGSTRRAAAPPTPRAS